MTVKKAPTKRSVSYALRNGIKIGEGSYREVYRTKMGKWVYKLNLPNDWYGGGNDQEYETYLKFKDRKLPEGVRIPEMHLIEDVLVAEYIEGYHPDASCCVGWHSPECPDNKTCWTNKLTGSAAKITDLHSENVIITSDGTIYIIDLGCGSD